MKIERLLPLAAICLAVPAFADEHGGGDAEAGEKEFRKCKACHMIVDDAGEQIVRGGRTGPNLHGVIGRAAGGVEDFRYSDLMTAAGEGGLVWDEASLAAYVQAPTAYLKEVSGESSGRSKMSYKVRGSSAEEDAKNLAAYLATFSDMSEDAAEDDGEDAEG